jgi:ribonuclease HII
MSDSKNKKSRDLNAVRGASEARDQDVHSRTARGANERSNKEPRQRPRFIVGVDEAGRGPLAGPVAVGVAVVPYDFDWRFIPGVGDSKQVKEQEREKVVKIARALRRTGVIDFHVALVPASTIDRIGITDAVRKGIDACFKKLKPNPKKTEVKLDGLLKAPKEFTNQETIIKGDAKEKVIGLASILAKVARDHHMVRVASDYPKYGFEIHKGYGTKKHQDAIARHGLSKIHRRSFCKKFDTRPST